MQDEDQFVDYYALLQVSPDCDDKILDMAYHHFAKVYHPDRLETADVDKFNELTECYRLLKDAKKRAEYDRQYEKNVSDKATPFRPNSALLSDQNTAINDAKMHDRILLLLYKKRREDAANAGIVPWLLQEILECPEQQFEFHSWYLKSKGFLQMTEEGTLAITIEGVDHVIANSLSSEAAKLLLPKDEQSADDIN